MLFSLLPVLVAVLSIEDSGNSWSLIIVFLNLNMLSFFIGSAFWPGKIIRLGYFSSAKITILGYFLSNALFVVLLLGATKSVQFNIEFLVLIGVSRLFMGFFSSAFMPIAQGSIYAQTSCEQRQYKKLSKISGTLTLGRLAGPGLVLLPVDWLWVLAIPFVPMFWSFFKRPSISFSGQEAELSTAPNIKALSLFLLSPPSLIAPLLIALSTTALVASFQLALAPEMTSLIGDVEQASEMLAFLMLGLSMLLFILQVWVMPRLAKWLKTRLFIIAFGLVGFGLLALIPDPNLTNFILAGLALALSIAGLPPWYSQVAFRRGEPKRKVSETSGLLAQSHSLGHLVGTTSAALCLSVGINALYASSLFALVILSLMWVVVSTSRSLLTTSISESKGTT
ncbi:possible H+-antiporter [Vibrio maritimus]|uniref:Possible H+-antiporter n=1 Tax=Vibrio maritimus TaxID=990268 RepID=A0A090TXZ3_9VIBR|nr:possible H+-antiporter [Vibrio maritimus]